MTATHPHPHPSRPSSPAPPFQVVVHIDSACTRLRHLHTPTPTPFPTPPLPPRPFRWWCASTAASCAPRPWPLPSPGGSASCTARPWWAVGYRLGVGLWAVGCGLGPPCFPPVHWLALRWHSAGPLLGSAAARCAVLCSPHACGLCGLVPSPGPLSAPTRLKQCTTRLAGAPGHPSPHTTFCPSALLRCAAPTPLPPLRCRWPSSAPSSFCWPRSGPTSE